MSEGKGWLARLRAGLTRSSSRIGEGISAIFTRRKLDDDALEALEELLITADLGPQLASRLATELAKDRFGKDVTGDEVREFLATRIAARLAPVAVPLAIDAAQKPFIVLVAGVNGAGKTTTIGKLAQHYRSAGLKVWLAAGDTFRAAAVEQLKIWGQRTGCPVVARDTGADAAALAYEAINEARAAGADLLFIDTAGRLHNRDDLMAELKKVVKVIGRQAEGAPHATLLVLDATTGQNAHAQVEIFGSMVDVTGLVVTKLDGSAKGGVLVALAEKFGLPVHAIGVGEGVEDLQAFDPGEFARSLLALNGRAGAQATGTHG